MNELSSALKRRFNTVVLPVPDTMDEEVAIVQQRVASLGRALELPNEPPALEEIRRVVTVFRELRDGKTLDGKSKLKQPSGSLSTAEAISVMTSGMALAAHFGDGTMKAADMASGMLGAIVKDPVQDKVVMQEYLETVVKNGWVEGRVPGVQGGFVMSQEAPMLPHKSPPCERRSRAGMFLRLRGGLVYRSWKEHA